MALSLAAFVIGLVEHDYQTAVKTFERALALSPSSAFTLFMGCIVQAYAGNADNAIEWGERALRISPFDRLAYLPHQALAISHFQLGRPEETANAARRAAESNPDFSGSHILLAAALAKLGRAEAAKAAAMHVLALQPSFSAREFCAAVGIAPALAEPLTDAWRQAGLP
jgi:adenylate cyclase